MKNFSNTILPILKKKTVTVFFLKNFCLESFFFFENINFISAYFQLKYINYFKSISIWKLFTYLEINFRFFLENVFLMKKKILEINTYPTLIYRIKAFLALSQKKQNENIFDRNTFIFSKIKEISFQKKKYKNIKNILHNMDFFLYEKNKVFILTKPCLKNKIFFPFLYNKNKNIKSVVFKSKNLKELCLNFFYFFFSFLFFKKNLFFGERKERKTIDNKKKLFFIANFFSKKKKKVHVLLFFFNYFRLILENEGDLLMVSLVKNVLNMKLLAIFFFDRLKNILKILQERSESLSPFAFIKKIFYKFSFAEENFSQKNRKKFFFLKKILKNLFNFLFFFRRKNKRFLKKTIKFWRFPEIHFYLKTNFTENFFFYLPDFILQIFKKSNIISAKKIFSNYTIGHNSKKKKKLYFLKYFFDFHQQISLFLKQFFIVETEKKSYFLLNSKIKNFHLKLTEKILRIILKSKKNQFIIFILIGAIRINFNLVSPYFHNVFFKANKFWNKAKNYPINHLILSLTNLILLANSTEKILIKNKKNFQIKKLKIKKKWSLFCLQSCKYFLYIKKEIFFEKKFKKKKYRISKEIKIQKKKISIKLVQNSFDFSIWKKKQEILHSKTRFTESKRIVSFVNFIKNLIIKNEKSLEETFEFFFLSSQDLNIIGRFYLDKKKKENYLAPNEIECCMNCFFSLFKYNFSIFKFGKEKKKKKSHLIDFDKNLFFLMNSAQIHHLIFCSFFFKFTEQRFLKIFIKKEKTHSGKLYRRKNFSFFLLNNYQKNPEIKKNPNSSVVIRILFVSYILKKNKFNFLRKNFIPFFENIKNKILWVLKDKDPMIEKFIHEFKKNKNKNFNFKMNVKQKYLRLNCHKKQYLPIFLTKFLSNLSLFRFFLNKKQKKEFFSTKLTVKNFSSVFSNQKFWLSIFLDLMKNKIKTTFKKKTKQVYFFCKKFSRFLIFYNLIPIANLTKNKCKMKLAMFFFILREFVLKLIKPYKTFSFKNLFNTLSQARNLFLKKIFSFLSDYFFKKPIFRLILQKKYSLIFFSSFYWFIMRKRKKNRSQKKKTYILLNDLIENNNNGDLVIFCFLLNINFVKIQNMRNKFFNFEIKITTNCFFVSKIKHLFRKNLIIKNCFYFIKKFIRKKYLFTFDKTGFMIFFPKIFHSKKKNFVFSFLKRFKKKKEINHKHFRVFSTIEKILESGFFAKNHKKFFLIQKIQVFIKIEKNFLKKKLQKKILEFLIFYVKSLPVGFLSNLIYCIKNFCAKKSFLKKKFLKIINCFFSYVPYIFKINIKQFIKKKKTFELIIKVKDLFNSIIKKQIRYFFKDNLSEKKIFFFSNLDLYSINYFIFSKNSFIFFIPLFFLALKQKYIISTNFKKIFPKLMFNLGLKIKLEHLSILILKNHPHFLIQKVYLVHFVHFFKGLFLNISLDNNAVFLVLVSILNFILKFLKKYFSITNSKKKNVNIENNFIKSLVKIVGISVFFFLNFFDYLWKSFFLNLMSTGFWGFQVIKIVVFKKILLKIFKNKKKKIVDFWKKTILFLNSRYHFAFDKKFSKRNFIENKIQFIQRLTVFFDSESRLKERKIFLNYFFTVFIKNFFYGNTFRSVRYFSYLGSFVRTVTYWNKKFYFYFFYICCSRFLFLIKTNIRSFISNNPDTWVFVFYPIANFPTFFYFKEVNWLKIIGFLSKKKILSNNSKKQLIGLNIIKKFIISKIFPFDFMNCILSSLFIFLKTTIYDNRFSANFILVHYFSCIKPNYKKFKIGLLLFIRCLYTKRINSKLIFFEIFLNLSSNSSKKFLNIFSKIIFPKLFFNFFLDFEKICTFFLGLVLKIFYLKLNAENFFYQIFKIQQIKKKKSKWFLIRIDMLWKKIFFFSTQKHASFLVDGISRFIVDFPNIYCFFSKKEWDIVYFFTLLCNYLLNQNSWIILTPLFYQLPWHKFFKQIFSDFFWIKKKKNKFIKFFFFKLSDSNILAFNRFSKKFFSFIFYFIKYMVVYSLNSTKNERKILYELIILKNFYPSLEKKISSFPQKSLNQKMLLGFEDKIFYFYDIMKHLKSSLKRSFYLSIYLHYSTKNLSNLFLYKSLFKNFSTKQYKKEFFFLGKIIKTFNKYF